MCNNTAHGHPTLLTTYIEDYGSLYHLVMSTVGSRSKLVDAIKDTKRFANTTAAAQRSFNYINEGLPTWEIYAFRAPEVAFDN